MRHRVKVKTSLYVVLVLAGLTCVVVSGVSCGTAPQPFIVTGPGGVGNDPPTLQILEPNANLTRSQGDLFLLRWTDTDRDDNAQISFTLVSTTTNASYLVVSGVSEDDGKGPDSFTVNTSLLPPGTYNILGVIDDGTNDPVEEFAKVAASPTVQRVVLTIVPPGEGPQTVPPIIEVTEPSFNQSVAQDDILTVTIQPTTLFDPNAENPTPFDPDSTLALYVLLDLDLDPRNDDPANPDPTKIIVLRSQTIAAGSSQPINFDLSIDLAEVPPRRNGEPYYIRATVDDGTNPRVHKYATGTINVVQLAAGVVDLFEIGRTKSGVRFQGFNPYANLGSRVAHVDDFDADGTDDFVLVAQFGNPQNVGPVGEAYLVYGQDSIRFGGTIPVNSVSDSVSGVQFHAPPIRTQQIPDPLAWTAGITDVSFIRDLNGDNRPELLFGLPHVHGAYDSTDYDPGDSPLQIGCYPDPLVNNRTTPENDTDISFYAGGMAVMVNSTNRDNSGLVNSARLEDTAVNLELVGSLLKGGEGSTLDVSGTADSGYIFPRADNSLADNAGGETVEGGRIAGSRFIAGGFDYITQSQPPREGLFGMTIRSLGDLTADDVDEIIISAPSNERYLTDLFDSFGADGTHLNSTTYRGSILVLPGAPYFEQEWREIDDQSGTAITPALDHWLIDPFGTCTDPPEPRHYYVVADRFAIFAEDVDDFLGDGQSAGDFNQDGLDDILCGAPGNDRTDSLLNTGAAYIIYGRRIFGDVHLSDADDQVFRTPMLRIRGMNPGDQIGLRVTAAADLNGDRIGDDIIASETADFGDVERATCAVDFNGDGATDSADLALDAFENCVDTVGDELFGYDACKAFDYNNNAYLDFQDRCVFCCLSSECEVDPSCVYGQELDCCANLVNNGFIGVVFGGQYIDGDRVITQLATNELPGVIFYGAAAGYHAGADISSAGDFNKDGFGDLLITVPGESRIDSAGRTRQGVVYLIFGGTHLTNTTWSLADVGTSALPGIIFMSPYTKGRPNEAAPLSAAYIGDINNDGFGDIAIGNPQADFIDDSFPQGPDAPGTDPSVGRRSNVGEAYIIYGNNFGSNRELP